MLNGKHILREFDRAKCTGIVLSILLHGVGIWYLLTQLSLKLPAPLAGTGQTTNTVLILTANQPAKPQTKARARPKTPHHTSPSTAPRKSSRAPHPPLPPTTTPAPPVYRQSVEEDFSTHLQAARQRREASTATQSEESTDSAPTPNEIARANIQAQREWMGLDQAKSGGIFEVRDITPFRATLIFRGWNPERNRNTMQFIPVERGNEDNIEMAVVNQMIVIIRQKTQEDIPWRSQRLGRVITLSARIKDTRALQQFLMQEMFYQNGPPTESSPP